MLSIIKKENLEGGPAVGLMGGYKKDGSLLIFTYNDYSDTKFAGVWDEKAKKFIVEYSNTSDILAHIKDLNESFDTRRISMIIGKEVVSIEDKKGKIILHFADNTKSEFDKEILLSILNNTSKNKNH